MSGNGYPIESASEAARNAYGKAVDERRLRNIWRESSTAAITAALDAVDLVDLLTAHAPDQTSYDAGDLHGCLHGDWEGDDWDAYHAHVAEMVRAELLEGSTR